MTQQQQEDSKILVSVRLIKWFSGISATAAIGCFIFLWNMNSFRATVTTTLMQMGDKFQETKMTTDRLRNDLDQTRTDVVHLQDNKADKKINE